jgi:Coenzyme PQQ synthesis protein D (PqqD)
MSPESPSPSVRKLPSGEGLVLLDRSSNCLWAYNDSAREVWEQIECGGSSDDIATDLAERYDIPSDVARADVSAILGQWRSHGLVGVNGERASPLQPATTTAMDWSRQPEPRWAASFIATIRGKVFALAIEPAEIAEFIRIAFQHLVTPQALPDVRMQVRLADDGESALIVDGIERIRMREGSQVVGAVDQVVLEHLYPGIEWLALMHGGGIARDGAGFAIPAACGSGKTTLIAYLIANKGFTYIADDLIALATDGRLVPWPMPLGPKEGSWKLLSEWYPYLPSAPNYRTQLGEARQIFPPPDAWDTEPVLLRGFIFPRYVAGAVAQLIRLTPLEALQRLLSDRIWLGYPMTEQRVSAFLARLEDMPAYSLVHGNVVEAAPLLDEIT